LQRPLVGEFMSDVCEPNKTINGAFDYFANNNDFLVGKPIDVGRLFYIKLYNLYFEDKRVLDFEVVWNHQKMTITGMVEVKERVIDYTFKESEASARRERHALVDKALRFINEKVESSCNHR